MRTSWMLSRRTGRTWFLAGLMLGLVLAPSGCGTGGGVDAENEALATGRDWRLLRPRVDEIGRALSAVLAGGPEQEAPAGGEPGRPAPGG